MIAKITIIDDDDAVRDSMVALLQSCDYEVKECASAEDFLARPANDADCLLVDHHMPGMSGLDLLDHLRTRGDLTPALMITGRIDSTIAARAERIGVKLLQKPVVEEQLVFCIEQARRRG